LFFGWGLFFFEARNFDLGLLVGEAPNFLLADFKANGSRVVVVNELTKHKCVDKRLEASVSVVEVGDSDAAERNADSNARAALTPSFLRLVQCIRRNRLRLGGL